MRGIFKKSITRITEAHAFRFFKTVSNPLRIYIQFFFVYSAHGSRYSRSSPYASEEPLSHSMTSLSSDAVRCDVIRTSVGASDVSPHGDVVSCSISSTNRRRSTPWQYLGPAMKRRKAMLPLQGMVPVFSWISILRGSVADERLH